MLDANDMTIEARPGQSATLEARRIRVEGIVQGVGYRPFVWALAMRMDLAGFVANDTTGVVIEVEGSRAGIERFVDALSREAPSLAVIEKIVAESVPAKSHGRFEIVDSQADGERQALICPDIGTCDECLREVFDPRNRRYRYPFTNCTNCGPRFTIIRGVPYDRPLTSMAGFAMCPDCEREYHDPADRRFHAQPVCCPACGPELRLLDRVAMPQPGDPICRAAALLKEGRIIAVKGLGGYHLAALASDESAVATLRARKHREDKPFAVMAPDLDAAQELATIDAAEQRLLTGQRRPIVLLARRADAKLAQLTAPGSHFIGLMLPYTPMHNLLCRELGAPLVLTSGNISDEPIAFADTDALRRLSAIADFYLTHDRPIHVRADDSVMRVVRGREVSIRRSRGFAPEPLTLPDEISRPILACGAELKNTFCLAKGRHAFLSHHIGDLENFETYQSFTNGIEHFQRAFDIEPSIVAHDLHPDYLLTKYALELARVELVGVQHHHAHIASCLADNGQHGPAIGVAFDGLGYGLDGTIWGGEFLVADLEKFERAGHLQPVPMPGGTAAIKQPWRMAAAHLDAAYGNDLPAALDVVSRNRQNWAQIVRLARNGINSPLTSSVGRLFDAVASILGIRDAINYEGQAAIELEQIASPSETSTYAVGLGAGETFTIRATDLVRALSDDLLSGTAVETIAARFQNTLAVIVVDTCNAIRARTGLSTVALSGGVFQNQFLLARTVEGLDRAGFRVLTHSRVPANDGGISFGQVAVAAARDRNGNIVCL